MNADDRHNCLDEMGASSSSLHQLEIDELRSLSSFSEEEIARLYARFKLLDKTSNGSITTAEMLAIPEFAMNPLANRIISVLDVDQRGEINFRQFVSGMSVFSRDARRDSKLEFAFKVYDVNSDGVIDRSDLRAVIKIMVGEQLGDEEIQHLVDSTMLQYDADKDGLISFQEFKITMFSADLEKGLSIEF